MIQPTFDGIAAPTPPLRTAQRRRTQWQRDRIAAGMHPATGVALADNGEYVRHVREPSWVWVLQMRAREIHARGRDGHSSQLARMCSVEVRRGIGGLLDAVRRTLERGAADSPYWGAFL